MYMMRDQISNYVKNRTGVFGQFFLAGNRVAALYLAIIAFLAGNHISYEQRE